ncbi:hypothetical protein QNH10_09920 [Sporosarcina thermotolerans]|uniref:hypothetical protein n=1 Tax=Sporosarcina thermotolerans TaxID=633404 RepID=UPI0024BC93C9|nr:hypothetical protein [Sporosarcina thermotolerans]WHT49758.1 hypothetical protein QNH10_09920 [Sporosarcina thermotolerans]
MEKKLEFLNKSYHRLLPIYIEDNIYKPKSIEPPSNSVVETKTKVIKRKPFLLWGTGVAVLIGLLFISVIRSDAYQYSTSEKFIEELKASFEQKIDDRYTLMGFRNQRKIPCTMFLIYLETSPKERLLGKLEI